MKKERKEGRKEEREKEREKERISITASRNSWNKKDTLICRTGLGRGRWGVPKPAIPRKTRQKPQYRIEIDGIPKPHSEVSSYFLP